jgi:hypothetical protein
MKKQVKQTLRRIRKLLMEIENKKLGDFILNKKSQQQLVELKKMEVKLSVQDILQVSSFYFQLKMNSHLPKNVLKENN